MKTKYEEFFFFWGEAPFSQWSQSLFDEDGVKYTHAEQYMMAKKALLFGDTESHKEIMAAGHPAEQKAIGRKVKNFVEAEWNKVAKEIVYNGNKLKFTQNPDMLEALIRTAPATLVEASPKDRVWGIGLAESDKRCRDRATWQGTNWLGEVLTQLREDLAKVYGCCRVIISRDFQKDTPGTASIMTQDEYTELTEKHRCRLGPTLPMGMSSYHMGTRAACEKWIAEDWPKEQERWQSFFKRSKGE